MLPGHHKVYNVFALKSLIKPVEVPATALGVGTAEDMSPVMGAVKYPIKPKTVTQPDITHASYERTQIDGFSKPIKAEDFPKELWMGNPLGGV